MKEEKKIKPCAEDGLEKAVMELQEEEEKRWKHEEINFEEEFYERYKDIPLAVLAMIIVDIQELLAAQKEDLLKRLKIIMETYVWDMDLDDDSAISISKNRVKLLEKIRKTLTPNK